MEHAQFRVGNLNEEVFVPDCPCQGGNLDKLLQPTILLALSRGPLYGIDIVYAVSYSPLWSGTTPDSTGVYRYLKRMEGAGLLASRWEEDEIGGRPRRLYSITTKGRACRNRWQAVLREYAAGVAALVRQLEQAEPLEYAEASNGQKREGRT